MSPLAALKDFRCGAQNSVGIGGTSDIQVDPGGLKSGAYHPLRTSPFRPPNDGTQK
jgi:hypothetical protein